MRTQINLFLLYLKQETLFSIMINKKHEDEKKMSLKFYITY